MLNGLKDMLFNRVVAFINGKNCPKTKFNLHCPIPVTYMNYQGGRGRRFRICWLKNFGDFLKISIGWFMKLSVQTF